MKKLYRLIKFMVISLVSSCLFILYPTEYVFAKKETKYQGPWSYSIQKDVEKSSRSYLFIYRPQEPKERRIHVMSNCQKEFNTEGVYGKCVHKISISPTGNKFILSTGEDVVMIQTAWDSPLVLGTIDYGCCAENVTITFYTEDGTQLGKLYKTPGMMCTALYGNTITSTVNLGNSTGINEKKKYFVVELEDNDEISFYAWVKNKTGSLKKVPIHLEEDETLSCGQWFLSEFVRYGDKDEITLILEGIPCNESTNKCLELDKRYFSCREGKSSIECKEKK